jgi:uncharacterized membrane protein (UPF0127 family)
MHLEATSFTKILGRHLTLMSLLAVGLASVACSQSPPPPDPVPQPSPTAVKVELPHAVLPDGFTVDLELAVTPQEVADGLMYRPSLRKNRGMLFLFEIDRYPSFWMKNTLIPLDMVFLDGSGTVVDIAANVPPCASDPCPTYSPSEPALAVLEVAAGTAEAHGVTPGSALSFSGVAGYPVVPEE